MPFIPPVANRIEPGQTAKQVQTNFNAQIAAIEEHVNELVARDMLEHPACIFSASVMIDSSIGTPGPEAVVGILQVPVATAPVLLDRFVLYNADYAFSSPSSTDVAPMRIVVKKGSVARNVARFDWWREWEAHQGNGDATIDIPLLPIDVRGATIEIWAFDNASASFIMPALFWFRSMLAAMPEEE